MPDLRDAGLESVRAVNEFGERRFASPGAEAPGLPEGRDPPRRVLFASPEPDVPVNEGNRARIHQMTGFFRSRGWQVDFCLLPQRPMDLSILRERHGDRLWSLSPRPWRMARMRAGNAVLHGLRRMNGGRLPRLSGPMWGCFFNLRASAWCHPAWKREFLRVVAAVRPDVVVVEYAPHADLLPAAAGGPIGIVDTHDVLADRYSVYLRNGWNVGYYSTSRNEERRLLQRADLVLAIQDQERAYFEALGVRSPLTFPYVRSAASRWSAGGRDVVFVGSANRFNEDAARRAIRIVSRVRETVPSARLVIGGRVCRMMGEVPAWVEMPGEFNDPREVYGRAALVLCPLLDGTGQNIKVLEALAHGVPLVASDFSVRALGDRERLPAVIARDDDEFVEAVASLLADGRRAASLHDGAVRWYQEFKERAESKLEQTVEGLLRTRAGSHTGRKGGV